MRTRVGVDREAPDGAERSAQSSALTPAFAGWEVTITAYRPNYERAISNKKLLYPSVRYRPPRRAVIFVSNPSVRIGISGVWNGFFITASP